MLNTDVWRFGDDPEGEDAGEICSSCAGEFSSLQHGGLCRRCYQAEHGPDNAADLDPFSDADMRYRQDMKDAGRGHLLR